MERHRGKTGGARQNIQPNSIQKRDIAAVVSKAGRVIASAVLAMTMMPASAIADIVHVGKEDVANAVVVDAYPLAGTGTPITITEAESEKTPAFPESAIDTAAPAAANATPDAMPADDGTDTKAFQYRVITEMPEDIGFTAQVHVIGQHGNVKLLGFDDESSMKAFMADYAAISTFISIDGTLSISDSEAGDATIPQGRVAVGEDSLTNLSALEPEGAEDDAHATVVAIVDTGCDKMIAEQQVSVLGDDGMDDNGHGTDMARTVKLENPSSRIISIKAFDNSGNGSVASVYAGIVAAVDAGADIVNLSFSGYAPDGCEAVEEAVAYALERGCTVVAAAGNGGLDATQFCPGNVEGVFTVGACDADGRILENSNRGSCVDGYVEADTTSYAAARVSGWLSANLSEGWEQSVFLHLGGCKETDKGCCHNHSNERKDVQSPSSSDVDFEVQACSHQNTRIINGEYCFGVDEYECGCEADDIYIDVCIDCGYIHVYGYESLCDECGCDAESIPGTSITA